MVKQILDAGFWILGDLRATRLRRDMMVKRVMDLEFWMVDGGQAEASYGFWILNSGCIQKSAFKI